MTTTGALVISLDLELHWGVREKQGTNGSYAARLHGARTVVPRLLDLFAEFDIAATWAVVGFLFARSREELQRFSPAVRPAYREVALSPYGERVGAGEGDDPLHFAPSLIESIRRAGRQEIATHTFSHYYCLEPGQTREAFEADLAAACSIAGEQGIALRSIVFPRNQHQPSYDDVLLRHGIRAYRGNPASRAWQFADAADSRQLMRRSRRLVEAYAGSGSASTLGWNEIAEPSGLANVRATAFVRGHRPVALPLEPLRRHQLVQSLRHASRHGRLVHFWWHPHNFGLHQDESLAFLRRILEVFDWCRSNHGMESLTMHEVADRLAPASGIGRLDPATASAGVAAR